MSSSDRDGSAVKPTADETVPLMNDTTNEELLFYKNNSWWSSNFNIDDDDDDIKVVYCVRSFLLSLGILLLLGLSVLIVGVWALVQGTSFFSIAMLPTTSVIIVSALLVIVCVVMVLVGIAHILFIRFSGAQKNSRQIATCILMLLVPLSLSIVVVALGITAAALIPSLSETTQLSANTTFSNYLSDQSAQENFDNVQNNLKCCGVVAFTDYESIFNNLSVPVSCCNTTNPLANETTCPQIVSNAQQANQTGLIYSEGCVPQLQSVLQYILIVFAGVSITVGVLQILGNCMSVCFFFIILVYIYMNSN